MKVRLAKIAAALLLAASAGAQAQAQQPGQLYGAEAVARHNELLKLHYALIQKSLSLYRDCMELQIAIARQGGTPPTPCTMPALPQAPQLQWLETDPRKEKQ